MMNNFLNSDFSRSSRFRGLHFLMLMVVLLPHLWACGQEGIGGYCDSNEQCVGAGLCRQGVCVNPNMTPTDDSKSGQCGPNQFWVALSDTCVDCPPGTELSDEDEGNCQVVVCAENERVESNTCVPCEAGWSNPAGDLAVGDDTSCEAIKCGADHHVQSNACVSCGEGTSNEAGDPATGPDTDCEEMVCQGNERVRNHACIPCAPGFTSAAGSPATGPDTFCDPIVLCGVNEHVENGICQPCEPGTYRNPGDNASGPNTTCQLEDQCPNDPVKSSPGQCGCGNSDTDTDFDGHADCVDTCSNDPAKLEPGICGCGNEDVDSDGDGVLDCLDGCPADSDKQQGGQCGCGTPDLDTDLDGVADCNELCPNDPYKQLPGECGCGVADVDSDNDGALDCVDLCSTDPNKSIPGICGCGHSEDDSDQDGSPNCVDQCPDDSNKTLPGTCGCGVADVDSDNDGALDCDDECPDDPAKIQAGACGCFYPETPSCEPSCGELGELCGQGPTVEVFVSSLPTNGVPDGLTWSTAFNDLQSAIDRAQQLAIETGSSVRVLVSAGTYSPQSSDGAGFLLRDRVQLVGGFDPHEPGWSSRDPVAHRTALDGQHQNFHVVSIIDCGVGTMLDGFTITGGLAFNPMLNGGAVPTPEEGCDLDNCGAGLFVSGSNVTLRNLLLTENYAATAGGAISSRGSSVRAENVQLLGNQAFGDAQGGAVFVEDSTLSMVNTEWIDNRAPSGQGNGLFAKTSDVSVINSFFLNNSFVLNNGGTETQFGGQAIVLQETDLKLHNSIVWSNSPEAQVDVVGPYAGVVDIRFSALPLLSSELNAVTEAVVTLTESPWAISPSAGDDLLWGTPDDVRGVLKSDFENSGSPALLPPDTHDINGNGNTTERFPVDMAGGARVQGAAVDLGPYEQG